MPNEITVTKPESVLLPAGIAVVYLESLARLSFDDPELAASQYRDISHLIPAGLLCLSDAVRFMIFHHRVDHREEEFAAPIEKHVYFIRSEDTDLIKIGYTSELGKRVRAHLGSTPGRVTFLKAIYGDRKLERSLHAKFKHLKFKNEWFRADKELLDYIDSLGGRYADFSDIA